ncbi:MAG: type II toxin-antitoxin system PemK/MazF family toxin [Gammaproteobacteria bacterium]|nr:MAG: type II toxin-antitoxin system PemK/MazF family toxin [Gammaproteobacteria bacterium]TLY86966.1 MAG: type II toxin-antitoxin system PemK/MazF family toxin [Gammaproteobacteria bacterium]
MNRGEVRWYTFKAPDKKRPVLILTRESAIAILHSVTIAPITSTIRSIPTEVVLTEQDGLPHACAANFDNLQTVPKSNIGDRITRLTSRKMKETAAAVSFALGFDDE